MQSRHPSLSAVRTPEPRRGFHALRKGFSPHEQRRAPAQAGFALLSRGLELECGRGRPRTQDARGAIMPPIALSSENASPAGASTRSGRAYGL